MAHKYDAIPKSLQSELKRIVYSFDPENLSCDGECSRDEMASRRRQLCQEWSQVVMQTRTACGVTVDFDEFEEYMY